MVSGKTPFLVICKTPGMILLPNFQERVKGELDEIWTGSKFFRERLLGKRGRLFSERAAAVLTSKTN